MCAFEIIMWRFKYITKKFGLICNIQLILLIIILVYTLTQLGIERKDSTNLHKVDLNHFLKSAVDPLVSSII